jgi:hypothetical protein
VAGRYDIRVEDDDVDIALDADDERRWLESDDLNIPGFQEDKLPVWIESTTRNKPEDIPKGNLTPTS